MRNVVTNSSLDILIKQRNIIITLSSGFILSFISSFLYWYLPIRLNELGGIVFVGTFYAIARIIAASLSPLGGVVADVYGRKPLAVIGAILYIFAFLALLGNISIIWISVITITVVPILVGNSVMLLTLEAIDGKDRGVVVGILNIVTTIAKILGNAIIPLILIHLGVEPLITIAVTLCVIAAWIRLNYSETLIKQNSPLERTKTGFLSKLNSELRSLLPRGLKSAFTGLVLYLTLFGIMATLGSEIISTYLPVYFNKVIQFNIATIGFLYSYMALIRVTTYLLGGLSTRKIGYAYLVAASTTLLAILLIMLAATKSLLVVMVLLAFLSICEALLQVSIPPLYLNILDKYAEHKATIMHIQDSLELFISFGAPLLGALLWMRSPDLLFVTTAASLVLASLVLIPLAKVERDSS